MIDWPFSQNLRELRLKSICLQNAYSRGCATRSQLLEIKMLLESYIGAKFHYESKQADSKLVVFKNIKTLLQPLDVLLL